jgi:hypothetical protein
MNDTLAVMPVPLPPGLIGRLVVRSAMQRGARIGWLLKEG